MGPMLKMHVCTAQQLGVKTHMTVDDAHSEWFEETQGRDIKKGQVMEASHSLQGHLPSGKQWMQMTDKILEDLGFQSTTHDR